MPDSVTPWTVAPPAPLSMGPPKQEYWGGLPFSTPGDLPNLGIETDACVSCTGRWLLYLCATWEVLMYALKLLHSPHPQQQIRETLIFIIWWLKSTKCEQGESQNTTLPIEVGLSALRAEAR